MRTRLRSWLQRRRVERELDDELMFHVEMETNAHVARGIAPVEARRRALRDLGGVDQTKEAVRDVRASWIDTLGQDVRYAIRSLRRRPSEGAAVIAMLALGIGITTAMFTLVDALILRPVPFHQPEQLATMWMRGKTGGRSTVAPAVLRGWRDSGVFAGVEAANSNTSLIEVDGAFATRGSARVTPGLFSLLGGVQPVRGRLFEPTEGSAGATDRVLVSEDLWRSLYRHDPGLVGRRITVDGESLVVVGILPADFRFPAWNTELWRAHAFDGGNGGPTTETARAFVRLGSHLPQADALRVAMEAARSADPSTAALWPQLDPVVDADRYYERAAPLLAGGVLLVFVVLCANASSLLLARLTARQREFAMRTALGAARGRLMRQALVESSALGALAVAAGMGIAWALLSLSRGFLPEAFLVRTLNPLNLDVRAVVVTSATGILATLAAGLLPAWIGTRVEASETSLRVSDRSGTETRAARALTRCLLVGEIALACTLLVGATLLVRSFVNLVTTDRGLDTSGVMMAWVSFPPATREDAPERAAIARALEERIRELPAVHQVAWSYGIPPQGGVISEGEWTGSGEGGRAVTMKVDSYYVGPDFFALYGIPLFRGRTFTSQEAKDNVIVGERLAEALWPGQDPIGRSFAFGGKRRLHVVGLAREIHYPSLEARVDSPEFYEPSRQIGSTMMMSIRCRGACPDTAAIRHRLLTAHPAVRLNRVAPIESFYFEELARPRAAAALGFAFAAIAVIAAGAGLFSVLTYAVGRRRKEFGVRTALGASPSQVRQLVFRDGLIVTISGVALGTMAAWAFASALASLQYGVTISDPVSWLVVVGLLGAAAMLATWQPAARAMRADPVQLLREE